MLFLGVMRAFLVCFLFWSGVSVPFLGVLVVRVVAQVCVFPFPLRLRFFLFTVVLV